MYKTLVRSHLDYCDIIYHIPSIQTQMGLSLNASMQKLEFIQYQAALSITGTWQGSNRSTLYEELGWETLSDRRWSRRILQLHKIQNDKTPDYLKQKLPKRRRPLYSRNYDNMFYEIRCKTKRYQNSFFPDAISSWNNIITFFNGMPSFNTLKSHLIKLIRSIGKNTYGIHDPIGIRYLFQLRVGLSCLREHKRRHNFLDTPTDQCLCNNGIEDTNHFLFHCSLFLTQRERLVTNVTGILSNYTSLTNLTQSQLYLYGDTSITFDDKKQIVLSTIKYIKDTRRFSS